jgi:hypothetical protein
MLTENTTQRDLNTFVKDGERYTVVKDVIVKGGNKRVRQPVEVMPPLISLALAYSRPFGAAPNLTKRKAKAKTHKHGRLSVGAKRVRYLRHA